MTPVYFIPGMGTTKEVFRDVAINNPNYHFLEFPEPESGESLKSYALKLSSHIHESGEIILVGMSMGGFLAQEIALLKPVKKVILISSFSKGQDWQFFLKWIQKYKLAELMISRAFKDIIVNTIKVMPNYPKSVSEISLKMAKKFSVNYFEFAVKQLFAWNPVELNCPIIQIHGSKDELFPIQYVKPKYLIKNGGHLMIFTHAKEIREILEQELS